MKTRTPLPSTRRISRIALLALPVLLGSVVLAQDSPPPATPPPAVPAPTPGLAPEQDKPDPTAPLLKTIEEMKTEITKLRQEVETLRAAKDTAAKPDEGKPTPPAAAKTSEAGAPLKPQPVELKEQVKPVNRDLITEPSLVVPQKARGQVRRLDESPATPKAAAESKQDGKGQAMSEAKPAKADPVAAALRHDFRLPNGTLMRLRGETWISEQPFQNQTEVNMLAAGLNRSPGSPQVQDLVKAGYSFKTAVDGSLMLSR